MNPQEHRRWLCAQWQKLDRDVDKGISRDELNSELFRKALKDLLGGAGSSGTAYSRSMMRADRAVDFVSRKADNNGDGQLSFLEFERFTYMLRCRGVDPSGSRNMYGAKLWAEVLFAMFDLDCDNYLQQHEFRELHRYFHGSSAPEWSIANDWATLDTNGEGKASKDHFIRWMTRDERLRVLAEPPIEDGSMRKSCSAPSLVSDRPQRGNGALKHSISGEFRAPWNRRHHVVLKNDNKPRPVRTYFSRPKSEDELIRYYHTQPQFKSQLNRSMEMPDIKRPRMILSHETTPPIIPSRHIQAGLMSTSGKEIPPWTDLWQPSLSELRDKASCRPGSLSLRACKLAPLPRFDPDWD